MCLSIPRRLLLAIVSCQINVLFSWWNKHINPFGGGWILIVINSSSSFILVLMVCLVSSSLSLLLFILVFSPSLRSRGLKLHPRDERRERAQDERHAERNRRSARAVPSRTQFKQAAAKLQASGLFFQLLPQICGSFLTVCQSSGRAWVEIIPVTASQMFQKKENHYSCLIWVTLRLFNLNYCLLLLLFYLFDKSPN